MTFKQICKLFCIVIPWTAIDVLALFAITYLTKTNDYREYRMCVDNALDIEIQYGVGRCY